MAADLRGISPVEDKVEPSSQERSAQSEAIVKKSPEYELSGQFVASRVQ